MGLYATCLSNGPPVLRDATADSTLVTELQERIEEKRETITVVPGEGSILGVWEYTGDIYAFRNKTGGATAGMYKSTSTGWSEIDLGTALNFDSTTIDGEMVVGAALTGAGGATGTIACVSYNGNWDVGAEGTVVLTGITGTFVDDENLSSPTLSFDGGSVEILEGDTITGATSGETAIVKKIQIASGALSTGDAAGVLSVTSNTGTWTDGEEIHVMGADRADVNGSGQPSSKTIAKANGTQYAQTLQPSGSYKFVNFNFIGDQGIEKMYGADGVNNSFEWDGTTFCKIKTGMETDTPEYVSAFNRHLFLSYPKGSVQNSSLGAPTVWSTTMGAAEIVVGDTVTGFSVENKDSFAIFGRNNTYILYGTSRSDWNLTQFYTGSGAVGDTVQKMHTTIFLDDRGIVSLGTTINFGDFKQSVISQKIDPLVQKYKDKVVTSLRVRDKNQYRLYFNDKTGIAMTFLNGKNEGILPFTLDHQITCATSGEDSSGDEVLYGGFDDGYIRKIDSGTSLDGETVNSFVRLSYHHYGSPQQKKRFREILLELNADTSTTLTIQPEYNYGDGTVPITSDYSITVTNDEWTVDDVSNDTLGIAVVDKARARIHGVGETMGIIIKNSSIYDKPVTLQGAVVQYSERGLKR
tara:strand:+ start:3480 stop:5393 length:1914 start_codon:yes stop_codon:yes gene_type:complete